MGRVKEKKKKKQKTERQLQQAYYSAKRPGGFGGVSRLKQATGKKSDVVKNWLSFQDTYTLHKPVRRKFQRRATIVGGIDHQ